MSNLFCTVAVPDHELFSGEIAYASIPGSEGSYGVLPGHEMLVATNARGVLTLWDDADGNVRHEFLIYDGASEVFNDMITVLGRFGIDLRDIDADAVTAQAEDLRRRIQEMDVPDGGQDAEDELSAQRRSDLEILRQSLDWCEFQLETVKKPH